MDALRTTGEVDRQLVDEAIKAYVEWREECAAVWDAFGRWRGAPTVDSRAAFSAYGAALDREESAAHAYADWVGRIATHECRGAPPRA